MTNGEDVLLCSRCGRAVEVSATHYETFERMHYVCFHYEFEHDVDPDQECPAGGCPSGAMGAMGAGRDAAGATAMQLAQDASETPGWENETLAAYLEAFGGWLRDCPGHYASQRRTLPSNAWIIVKDALNAATVYE